MAVKNIQNLIDIIRGKKLSKVYLNKFYPPIYNINAPILSDEHEIYNKDGQKMRTFFIRDSQMAHAPFYESKYFIWDRFNFYLKTHFYTHECMLETMGKPDFKYGMLVESEAIKPKDYQIFKKHKGLQDDFDCIFTYSAEILDTIKNSKFVPFCASLFFSEYGEYDLHKNKSKDVSIISSNKMTCELHKYRYDLAYKCKNIQKVDTFGTFDGGKFINIADTLRDYRFSFCIENDIKPYFFSERLICALANQTVPIYIGATEIDKFFNPEGIIKINTKSNIEDVLKQCTKEEYERRIPAILDNWERAKKYVNPFDYMFENYLS